jgi:hypothetical protein
MSESTTDPASIPDVIPPVPDPPTPPQESTPDGGDGTEQEERQSKRDRRFAELSARLTAAERRDQERERELKFYRQQAAQVAPQDETPEQRHMRERAQMRGEVEAQVRTETFHQQGSAQFSDWKQRCDDLVKMGADAGLAALLVEMPDGVKVTAALAADPEEVERIAGLRTERARAVALGKYAATIDGAPVPPRTAANGDNRLAPPVTRAPAPIRPVVGRASPTFNEYAADAQSLVERYMKQNLERQQGR